MYSHLAEAHASERKDGMSDAQFYYKTRKSGFGPFKKEMWSLPEETKQAIYAELQPRFELVMHELGVAGQGDLIETYVKPIDVRIPAPQALSEAIAAV